MNDKIGDDRDPYFYSGLKVLHDILNIYEAAGLQEAELMLITPRAVGVCAGGPANMGLPWPCANEAGAFGDPVPRSALLKGRWRAE